MRPAVRWGRATIPYAREFVAVAIASFFLGVVTTEGNTTIETPAAPPPSTAVATITEGDVRSLVDDLGALLTDAATEDALPPATEHAVDDAAEVFDSIDSGEVVVVPTPPPATVAPDPVPSPTTTTTTTAAPDPGSSRFNPTDFIPPEVTIP